MSTFARYDDASRDYDTTRGATGADSVARALGLDEAPETRVHLLDAGCGSGNFSRALVEKVGRIDAVDMSIGMLTVAGQKLGGFVERGRVGLYRASIDALPFADESFDAAMLNQVLHHLEDGNSPGYPGHYRVLAELHRVLRPGGAVAVNLCSHDQLRHSFWFYRLIPDALDAVLRRCVDLDTLTDMLDDIGFVLESSVVPFEGVLMGEALFDPRGPLDDGWRNGDSIWALAAPRELESALSRVRGLGANGALEDFVREHDAGRRSRGQFTVIGARKAE